MRVLLRVGGRRGPCHVIGAGHFLFLEYTIVFRPAVGSTWAQGLAVLLFMGVYSGVASRCGFVWPSVRTKGVARLGIVHASALGELK